MPQLDALRAFAFVGVAVSHWTPNFLAGIVPWGTGVQLFFVLSGFLITGILLRSRPADLGISMGQVLRVFYLRRILRIFPLYYGVLALCLLFSVGPIASTWQWHVPYLSNLYYAWHGHGTAIADPYLHLWSLSVEEQFYLLWPLVALVASRRGLLIILFGSLVGSMLFRVGITSLAPSVISIRYLTPSCLDAFAVGGLIAYYKHYSGSAGVRRCALHLTWIGIAGLGLSTVALPRVIGSDDAHRIGHTFLVIFYGAIVAQGALGFRSVPGAVLNFKPVQYLGKISYGLYVYHYFAPYVVSGLARSVGAEAAIRPLPVTLTAYSIFTLLAAMASWHLYEYPINRLKRHFSYPRANAPGVPVAAAPAPSASNA